MEAQSTKDALKYATIMPGVQSVTMDLQPMMLMLLADSLDYLEAVSIATLLVISQIKFDCFFDADASARCCAAFGQGTGDILLDDLGCTGTENSLFDCPNRGIGVHNCAHSEDVGVVCQGMSDEFIGYYVVT